MRSQNFGTRFFAKSIADLKCCSRSRDLDFLDHRSILLVKLVPVLGGLRNRIFWESKENTALARSHIKLSVKNLECFGFYVGDLAER